MLRESPLKSLNNPLVCLTHNKTNKVMDIPTLVAEGSRVSVTIDLNDLIKFGEHLISKTKRDLEQTIIEDKAETYPTPKQVTQILNVDLSTLWRWAKRGYLVPLEIGGKRRYRMSEVKALLNKGVK